MRNYSAPAALLALLLGVAGCGGVGGTGGGTGGSGRLTTLGFSLPDEIATSRIDAFKQANPEITVEVTEGGFDEQQFLSAVADGNPPDLVYLDRKLIGTYATGVRSRRSPTASRSTASTSISTGRRLAIR